MSAKMCTIMMVMLLTAIMIVASTALIEVFIWAMAGAMMCGLMWLVSEFACVQQGKQSWRWIERLYHHNRRLQHIRW